ncbi:hypothetical protein BgiBS90_003372 [Biomphalaria glabrata]|nr:hypothetical protein BgiBS90_003372 [Biomphalaria glabrata]
MKLLNFMNSDYAREGIAELSFLIPDVHMITYCIDLSFKRRVLGKVSRIVFLLVLRCACITKGRDPLPLRRRLEGGASQFQKRCSQGRL